MAETEDKDPLLGNDEVSGDVVEGYFFYADRLSWLTSCHIACYHMAIASRDLSSISFKVLIAPF